MKKGFIVAAVVILAIVAVCVIGSDFLPTVDGAMPKPGG